MDKQNAFILEFLPKACITHLWCFIYIYDIFIVAIFERLRNVLHEGKIDVRVQYMVEVMFAIRKDGFKDHQSVIQELDLVDEEDQFTHLLTLEDEGTTEDILSMYTYM